MKRLVLAGTATAALTLMVEQPAHALFGVGDIVNDPELNIEQKISNAMTAGSWASQAKSMVQQIQYLNSQLQQLQTTYNALAHATDMGSVVSGLSALGIQNPLPVNPYNLQSVLQGNTNGTGPLLSNLSGLMNSVTQTNRVYTVPGNSWVAQQINASGGGLAGAQAVALQLYQSASDRVPYLNQLQAQIASACDPSERESLMARFLAEQAYIQNAQVQAGAVGNYMQAQFQVQQQRGTEKMQQDIDAVLQNAQSQGICTGCAS